METMDLDIIELSKNHLPNGRGTFPDGVFAPFFNPKAGYKELSVVKVTRIDRGAVVWIQVADYALRFFVDENNRVYPLDEKHWYTAGWVSTPNSYFVPIYNDNWKHEITGVKPHPVLKQKGYNPQTFEEEADEDSRYFGASSLKLD